MNGINKTGKGALCGALLLSALTLAGSAQAGSQGRKNTAAALGALTVTQILKGNTRNAILAGAGTLVAYDRYQDSKDRDDRYGRYDSHRDRDWRDRERRRDEERRRDLLEQRRRDEERRRIELRRLEEDRRARELSLRLHRDRRDNRRDDWRNDRRNDWRDRQDDHYHH